MWLELYFTQVNVINKPETSQIGFPAGTGNQPVTNVNWFDATAYCERAVDLIPSDPTIAEHLGDVYWRSGRELEARFGDEEVFGSMESEHAAGDEGQANHALDDDWPEVPSGRFDGLWLTARHGFPSVYRGSYHRLAKHFLHLMLKRNRPVVQRQRQRL